MITHALAPATRKHRSTKRPARTQNAVRREKLDLWRITLGDALIATAFGLTDAPRLHRMPNTRGLPQTIREANVYGLLADQLDPAAEHGHVPKRTGFPFNPRIRRPSNWHPRKAASA